MCLLAAIGCDLFSEKSPAPNHRMGFLPEDLRQPPASPPPSYLLHPPYWGRIHRDSLWLVVDHPIPAKARYYLGVNLMNPRSLDTLDTFGSFLDPDSGGRAAIRVPMHDRAAWSAPAVLELVLVEVTESGVGEQRLASRRWWIDPDIGQLDLKPFPAHFHPEREGMTFLFETVIRGRDSSEIRSLEIKRLMDLRTLPGPYAGRCEWDSVVQLRFQVMTCPQDSDADPQAALARCEEALESDLASAGGLSSSRENIYCAGEARLTLDSAEVANRWLRVDHRFGKDRIIEERGWSLTGGFSGSYVMATGLGEYQSQTTNAISAIRTTTRLLAVR